MRKLFFLALLLPVVARGGLWLAWDAVPGCKYRVYVSTNLTSWRVLTNTAACQIPLAAESGPHFYRVSSVNAAGMESVY